MLYLAVDGLMVVWKRFVCKVETRGFFIVIGGDDRVPLYTQQYLLTTIKERASKADLMYLYWLNFADSNKP